MRKQGGQGSLPPRAPEIEECSTLEAYAVGQRRERFPRSARQTAFNRSRTIRRSCSFRDTRNNRLVEGSTLATLAIRVRPRDMAMFDRVRALPADGSLTADERISQDDAAELLNTCAKYMPAVCAHHPLHFENDGGAQLAQKSAVIDVARQIASSAEIGMHLNVRAKSVETRMRDLRVPRIGSFWCRATLIDSNQLPALE